MSMVPLLRELQKAAFTSKVQYFIPSISVVPFEMCKNYVFFFFSLKITLLSTEKVFECLQGSDALNHEYKHSSCVDEVLSRLSVPTRVLQI